ncbi:MAG: winged helix-turn-helix transcriptional regulator [Candidatus Aenigmarchaeota archaeon]|nr:winged helix-turn-helix transcriptional regulator [Candidatus Aenigmarchaeota archaeon]
MVELDVKDKKILYHLDLNCRQSNSQIGKKVGLSRKVVSYRIKRMEEEGVIKNYWTAINAFKLGYQVFRVYIKFQDVTEDKKQEIIEYFASYKNVWTMYSSKVPIDLGIVIWVKKTCEFYRFWDKTLTLYEPYFAEYSTSIYITSIHYKKTYLINDKEESENRKLYETSCESNIVDIDEIDYQLLNTLALNARIPLVELAEKLGCSSQNVNYKIKNLMKSRVINGFRVNLFLSEIGMKNFKVDIYLKDYAKRKAIIEYLEKQPYFVILNVAIGWADIEPELIVDNVEHLLEILEDLNKRFPNAVKKNVFWITSKQHKFRWLPELTEKDFKS